MKIVHIAYEHNSNDVRIYRKECVSLSKRGNEVFYITSNKNYQEPVNDINVKKIIINLRGKKKIRLIHYYKDLFNILIDMDADIYHFHENTLLPVIKKIKRRGKRVIYDMHESPIELMDTNNVKVWRRLFLNLLAKYENSVLKCVDSVITVTPQYVEYAKKFNSTSLLITNYPIMKTTEEIHSFNNNNICFAGTISPNWHQKEIIKALEKLSNVEFLLAGSIEKDYLEELQRMPSWENVVFSGVIPFDQVKDLYKNSIAGIALFKSGDIPEEGTLGNTKLFEYMSEGLPVICTNYPLWKEVIEENNCGLCIDPDNVSEITDAIEYIMDNKNIARKMGENGRKAIERYYNWSKEEKKLFKLYDRMEAYYD